MTRPKQPINKTIGINKLGTLLSSQTTDTPGTTTTSTAVDRSGATFQTYPVSRSFANRRFRDFELRTTGPTCIRHAKKRAIFRLLKKGVCRYFSASAAATQKTIHGRNLDGKSTLWTGLWPPKSPCLRGSWGPHMSLGGADRRNGFLCTGSHGAEAQERPPPAPATELSHEPAAPR